MEHFLITDDLENSYKNLIETLSRHIHTLATFNITGNISSNEELASGEDPDYINQLLFI